MTVPNESGNFETALPQNGHLIVRLLGDMYLFITYDRLTFANYALTRKIRSAQVYSAPYIYVVQERSGLPEGMA